MEYYTYAYLRADGTPYYIGKGKGKRAWGTKRTVKKPKQKDRIIILKKDLTEDEAMKHEIYMIAIFGRKDIGTGILRNMTDGGDGVSGYKHSEETKAKMSRNRKGKGLGLSHFHLHPNRRTTVIRCIATGEVRTYPSITQAAKAIGTKQHTLSLVLRGKFKKTKGWTRVN